MTQKEIDELWYSQKSIPGAKFKLNDSVKIKDGIYKDEYAAVISLLILIPIPKYTLELGSNGESFEESEDNLEFIG